MARITEQQYRTAFAGKETEALRHAHEIRKFEIELYWKRAAYFWTLIAASLAGYGALQIWSPTTKPDSTTTTTTTKPDSPTGPKADSPAMSKTDLSVLLSCLGLVLSFGWYCANRGSKQWQENWENHVDLLEDKSTGPLYKTVVRRSPLPRDAVLEHVRLRLTGPGSFSVSKINQIISVYVTVLWLWLLWMALQPFSDGISFVHTLLVLGSFGCCGLIYFWGQTYGGVYRHWAFQRESYIESKETPSAAPPTA